ncbi:MAG TPA: HepT-like ribonuclease domain-containing protein [Candidatus Lokiarchaeia archaeon]
MAGTRYKLIHHYFGLDNDLVWDIVEKYIHKVKETIKFQRAGIYYAFLSVLVSMPSQ